MSQDTVLLKIYGNENIKISTNVSNSSLYQFLNKGYQCKVPLLLNSILNILISSIKFQTIHKKLPFL